MASTFRGQGETPPSPIICPRKSTDGAQNTHLLLFSVAPAARIA